MASENEFNDYGELIYSNMNGMSVELREKYGETIIEKDVTVVFRKKDCWVLTHRNSVAEYPVENYSLKILEGDVK